MTIFEKRLILFLFSVEFDPTDKKLALIIANSKYNHSKNQLLHSVDNAHELETLLQTIDFNVTSYIDIDSSAMRKIMDFAANINDGDLVLFYYCGHCHQVDGKNYLIPIDDENITRDLDVQDIGIRVDNILRNLKEKNKSNATIFILDCARPYFFQDPKAVNCKLLI